MNCKAKMIDKIPVDNMLIDKIPVDNMLIIKVVFCCINNVLKCRVFFVKNDKCRVVPDHDGGRRK